MGHPAAAHVRVATELRMPVATAQLVHFDVHGPAGDVMHERDNYWLDLCLTPRPANARACYRNHWSPHRFER